jgi:hypothetical protein
MAVPQLRGTVGRIGAWSIRLGKTAAAQVSARSQVRRQSVVGGGSSKQTSAPLHAALSVSGR